VVNVGVASGNAKVGVAVDDEFVGEWTSTRKEAGAVR
jgi:hypothetical protein